MWRSYDWPFGDVASERRQQKRQPIVETAVPERQRKYRVVKKYHADPSARQYIIYHWYVSEDS